MTNGKEDESSAVRKSILIRMGLLGLGYFWGVLTYHKQLFPFDQARYIKHALVESSVQPTKRLQPDKPEWRNLQETNEAEARNTIFQTFTTQANVVMIGDSITELGEWSDIFPRAKIVNRGIRRDRTEDILHRMQPIIATNAKKAFLMAGINDISSGKSVDTIFNNYTNIVTQLKNKGTAVYIQSTLECSANKCGNRLQKVRELNNKLKAYAAKNGLTYININAGLTNEKEGLLSEYTWDGIHLLGNGYLKWRDTISPYVHSK